MSTNAKKAVQNQDQGQTQQVEVDPGKVKDLIAKHGNKSKAIRAMSSEGMTRGQIAKTLGIRYQHVRNVLITPVKNQA